ncbi:hypothetical protein BC943DRAFT_355939 [Umbelopsis sp. AD052]|nr:hypothetical protein BC943DRAFT_355939 [Umbelopsis sp. AD052]
MKQSQLMVGVPYNPSSGFLLLLETHILLPLVANEDVERVHSAVNGTRLLILNSAGVVNEQRNNILLRAVNPEFQKPQSEGHYTMPMSTFQETLAQQSALHKAMKDAQPKKHHSKLTPQVPQQQTQRVFRTIPSPGGGGREQFNFKNPNGFKKSNQSNNPYKNRSASSNTNMISEGFQLHFTRQPHLSHHAPPMTSDPQQRKLLRQEISQLLAKRAIKPLFKRVTKPVLTWARSQGIRVSAYLDDWIVVADSYQKSLQHKSQLTNMMATLGWGKRSGTSGSPFARWSTERKSRPDNPQPDYEDSCSCNGNISDEHVYTSTHVLQEQIRSSPAPLGSRSSSTPKRPARTKMVARQPCDAVWGGVGMRKFRSRGLVSRRSVRIHQLARGQGNRTHTSAFQMAEELDHPGTLVQHNRHGVHQQTGWHSIPITQSTSEIDLGKVSQEELAVAGQTHTGLPDYGGVYRTKTLPSQKHMADLSSHIPDDHSTTIR